MTTPLMFKAGDRYALITRMTGHELPIVWDIKTQKLYSRNVYQLHIYLLIIVFVVGGLCMGPTLFKVFTFILTKKHQEYDDVLLQVLAMVLAFIGYGCGIVFAVLATKYADDVVVAVNALVDFETLMRYTARWTRKKTNGLSGADILGYIMNVLPFLPITLVPFVCIFGVYRRLDPLYFFLEQTVPSPILNIFWVKMTLIVIRFLALAVGAIESLNCLVGVAFMCLMAARGINDSVRLLEQYYLKLVKKSAMLAIINTKYISLYNNLTMCMQILSMASSSVCFYLLGGSVVFCVMGNYATINFYHLLPLYLYILCPAAVGVVILATLFGIPLAVVINDVTTRMLHTWRYNPKCVVGQKYLQRRIAAMRPIVIYAGPLHYNFFSVKTSTKANYYKAILDYTCTALLAIPVD